MKSPYNIFLNIPIFLSILFFSCTSDFILEEENKQNPGFIKEKTPSEDESSSEIPSSIPTDTLLIEDWKDIYINQEIKPII